MGMCVEQKLGRTTEVCFQLSRGRFNSADAEQQGGMEPSFHRRVPGFSGCLAAEEEGEIYTYIYLYIYTVTKSLTHATVMQPR